MVVLVVMVSVVSAATVCVCCCCVCVCCSCSAIFNSVGDASRDGRDRRGEDDGLISFNKST